jgi:hypothetical protein
MNPSTAIPAGYRQDAQGRLVGEGQIKPIDQVRDKLVYDIVEQALGIREGLVQFKLGAFADIEAFVDLSLGEYGVQVGGRKGNVTLMSFDGRYKVIRAMAERITFDERLQAAKELIDACLHEWTEGARDELRTLIQNAFSVDREGKIRTGQVLALRRYNIKDARWQMAMKAIADAVQVIDSKAFIRIYERDEATREYRAIVLDVARV